MLKQIAEEVLNWYMNNFSQTLEQQQQQQKTLQYCYYRLDNSFEYKTWLSREKILDKLNETVQNEKKYQR